MREKYKERAGILTQEKLASDVYSMWLGAKLIAKAAKPGQFISVYSQDGSRLLPRPISICEVNEEMTAIRIVYRVVGKGTKEFSAMAVGESLEILGPLGNGFPLERAEGKRAFLIGGGIGIPPILQLAKELPGEKQIVVGYRDELFLKDELEQYGLSLIHI